MSTKGTRRSYSKIALSFSKKQWESSTQRTNQRFREETEDDPPTITLSHTSADTITGEIINTNVNLLSSPSRIYSTDGLPIKLNCLKNKFARCTSHKESLAQSVTNKLVKGL